MEFQEVVRRRRMVRAFQERPVPRSTVDRILDNAVRAPSAGFTQGWAFVVLDEPDAVARFWDGEWPPTERRGSTYEGMSRAPVVIVPLANKDAYLDRYAEPDKGWTDRDESRWPVPFWIVDAAFASMLMLLTVVDEKLAAVFIGVRRADRFREAFAVPAGYTPIGAIVIGYPAPDKPSPSLERGRRGLEDVVHRNGW